MDGSNTPEVPVGNEVNNEPFTFHEVSTLTDKRTFPLMRQAAEKTGLVVNVNADEGQEFTTKPSRITRIVQGEVDGMQTIRPTWDRNLGERDFQPYTGTVRKGQSYVTISGTLPPGKDYGEFWDEFNKLRSEQPQPESPQPPVTS